MAERRLLSEDTTEIRLVPAKVREVWEQKTGYSSWGHRERAAWAEFLASEEGRQWLRERREEAHAD